MVDYWKGKNFASLKTGGQTQISLKDKENCPDFNLSHWRHFFNCRVKLKKTCVTNEGFYVDACL